MFAASSATSAFQPLRYLSLFSGIGGFECAIERVFPNAQCLGFSEIDKNALAVYKAHFPTHRCLGDITNVDFTPFSGHVDLVVGGSPCKDLSIARTADGLRQGLAGNQSSLFWHFVRCLYECRPRYFVLENVASMNARDRDAISVVLQTQPVMLNTLLFLPQRRRRLFWCNFHVPTLEAANEIVHFIHRTQPYAGARLEQVLETPEQILQQYPILKHTPRNLEYLLHEEVIIKGQPTGKRRIEVFPSYHCHSDDDHSYCLGAYLNNAHFNVIVDHRFWPQPFVRKFSPLEVERLQGFPDHFTHGLAQTQRYQVLGNAVTVPIIVYILCFLKLELGQHAL